MKKERTKKIIQTVLILILCLLLCFADSFGQDKKEQLPRLDTVFKGTIVFSVILTDKEGVKHEVYKDNGRSYVIIDGKRKNLFRKPEQN